MENTNKETKRYRDELDEELSGRLMRFQINALSRRDPITTNTKRKVRQTRKHKKNSNKNEENWIGDEEKERHVSSGHSRRPSEKEREQQQKRPVDEVTEICFEVWIHCLLLGEDN